MDIPKEYERLLKELHRRPAIPKEYERLLKELHRRSAKVSEQNSEIIRRYQEMSSRTKYAGFDLSNLASKSSEQMMRIQKAMHPSNSILNALVQTPRIAEMLSPVNQIAEAFNRSVAPYYQVVQQLASQMEPYEKELSRVVESYQSVLDSLSKATLVRQIQALQKSWILPDRPSQSVAGFARLSCLSKVARVENPYSQEISKLMTAELGRGAENYSCADVNDRDAAAIEAGLNPDLIAFPPSTYGEVVWEAGFSLRLGSLPVPQAVESADIVDFNSKYWRLLAEVELRLRIAVETHLKAKAGQDWFKKRVPEDVRQRCVERQEEERSDGRPVYSAIHYADLLDLIKVVERKDNWNEVFISVFRDKENFVVSLRRLNPVRKAIAHHRPLSRFDVLTLMSEATRLLSILGIRILH